MPDGVSEDREGLFSQGLWVLQIHHECSGRGIFHPSVGGLVRLHIAMGVFSEECFPCLSPTTVLVVVPEARLHILFTQRKRRKNGEIEAHSLHTSLHLDADLPFPCRPLNFLAEYIRQAVFGITKQFKLRWCRRTEVMVIVLDTII